MATSRWRASSGPPASAGPDRELHPQGRQGSSARRWCGPTQGGVYHRSVDHRVRRGLAIRFAARQSRGFPPVSVIPLTTLLVTAPALAAPLVARDSAAPSAPRRIADGIYAVPGDTGTRLGGPAQRRVHRHPRGRGGGGRPGQPDRARRLLSTIRPVTRHRSLAGAHPSSSRPSFGAIVFRRAGAKVIAHPDTRGSRARAGATRWWRTGCASWDSTRCAGSSSPTCPTGRSPGRHAPAGRADDRDHPSRRRALRGRSHGVAAEGTGAVRGRHPHRGRCDDGGGRQRGGAPSKPGADRQPAAAGGRARAWGTPAEPGLLVARTRSYIAGLEADMRAAVEKGVPMQRALASLPPPDENRPVSLNSRRRRNAARVYVAEERAWMGLELAAVRDRWGRSTGSPPGPGARRAGLCGAFRGCRSAPRRSQRRERRLAAGAGLDR